MVVFEHPDGTRASRDVYEYNVPPVTGADIQLLDFPEVPDWSPFFPPSPFSTAEVSDGLRGMKPPIRSPINPRRRPHGDLGDKRRWNWRLF